MIKVPEIQSTQKRTTDIDGDASKKKTRPMTLPEKILTHWAVGLKEPFVEPEQMICVKAQWTLACEITWKSMDKTYQVCSKKCESICNFYD